MSEEFAREVTKQAIARACTALEYKNIQQSSLDALADIIKNYVETLGEKTRDIAENSGRAIPGVQDVISSLDSMNHRQLATTWSELRQFALVDGERFGEDVNSTTVWSQPFPVSIPNFPAKRRRRELLQPIGESVPEWMPQHLPPFPPAHTYKNTRSIAKAKKTSKKASSHMASSKSVQESLAILEGVGPSKEHKAAKVDTTELVHIKAVTDESTAVIDDVPNRTINPAVAPVQSLPRDERILLGLLSSTEHS